MENKVLYLTNKQELLADIPRITTSLISSKPIIELICREYDIGILICQYYSNLYYGEIGYIRFIKNNMGANYWVPLKYLQDYKFKSYWSDKLLNEKDLFKKYSNNPKIIKDLEYAQKELKDLGLLNF